MIEGIEMNHGIHRKHRFAIVLSASVLLLSLMAMGTAHASTPTYSNGFETDTAGWFNSGGTITKQPSGYDNDVYAEGIASASGGFHARLDRGVCEFDGPPPGGGIGPSVNCSGPFTQWGGYGADWNGTYTTQVDIYLDAAYAVNPANEDSDVGNLDLITNPTDPAQIGTRFDYVSAINKAGDAGPNGHLRDFGFVVGTGQPGNTCEGWTVNAQTNTTRDSAFPDDSTKDPECITESGWYTFKHTFSSKSGYLDVLMEIIPVGGPANPDWTWDITGQDADGTYGCNRYGWFSDQEIFGLPIDNAEMAGGCGKTSPTIATTLSASGGIKGDTIHDSAKLTDATTDAGGTVNYRYYSSPADCTADSTGTAGTDVSTETVTNGTVPNSDDETFTTAGTFYWAAFYSGDARNNPAKSDCASEPLEIATQVGKITPTGTTCPQYQGSTAATLGQVRYTVTRGGAIGSVSPGVFFYYTKVTGSIGDTVAITQSHTGSAPTIPIQQKQVLLFSDPGCATLKWKTLTVTGGTATGTLPSTGSFIISVKYDTSSLKGKAAPDPPTSTYTFGTNHNGGPILADIARVDLVKK
jgi:hypothetical protein